MKTYKVFGTVALLAFALTALTGTGIASASQFRAEAYPAALTATQAGLVTKIQVATGNIKCETDEAEGSLAEPSSGLALKPALGNCRLAGQETTAAANGCQWVYHSTNESAPLSGTMDVQCAVGSSMSFAKEGCTVTIPSQELLEGVELVNEGTGESRTVRVVMNLSGVRYRESGASCAESGEHSTGVITGTSALSGSTVLRPVGVYMATAQVEAPHHFSVEYPSAQVWGEETLPIVFSFRDAKVGCNLFGTTGLLNGSSPDLSSRIYNSECRVAGTSVFVVGQGCALVLHAADAQGGGLGVLCEAGHEIELNLQGFSCKIMIPSQHVRAGVGFSNQGSGTSRNIEATLQVGGLEYSEHGGSCTSPGTHADGSIGGGWTLRAQRLPGGEALGLWVE